MNRTNGQVMVRHMREKLDHVYQNIAVTSTNKYLVRSLSLIEQYAFTTK